MGDELHLTPEGSGQQLEGEAAPAAADEVAADGIDAALAEAEDGGADGVGASGPAAEEDPEGEGPPEGGLAAAESPGSGLVEEEPSRGEEPVHPRPAGLAGVTRFRSVLLVGVCVGVIFAAALGFALLASGGNPDSVPGTDPIASLAAVPSGFLVGSTGGLAASGDGKTWSVAHLPSEIVAVTSNTSTAYVLAGSELRSTTDLHTFKDVASVQGTVIGASADGSVDVLDGEKIVHVAPDGTHSVLPASGSQPSGIVAIGLSPVNPQTVYLGGPVSGLWRSQDGGATWLRLDKIPVQALLVDPDAPQDIFVGTVGGVFVSTDGGQTWAPTSLRNDVNGLSASGGRIYAVGSDRLIYGSSDGINGWSQLSSR